MTKDDQVTSLDTQGDKTVCLAVTRGKIPERDGQTPWFSTFWKHFQNSLQKSRAQPGEEISPGRQEWQDLGNGEQRLPSDVPSSHGRVVVGKPGWFLEWQPQGIAAPENVDEMQVLRPVGDTQQWRNCPLGVLNSSQM